MSQPFEASRTISLATFKRDGSQVNTPVWVAGLGGKLYINTETGSAKVRRIRNNPRVRVAPCSPTGKIQGDWKDGTAKAIADAALTRQAQDAIRAKYGWQVTLFRFAGLFSRRFRERVVLEVVLAN